jgi:hypothetical protein
MNTAAIITHLFVDTELGHHLPAIQLVSFLKQTHVSYGQSPVQYCTTQHKEHLLVAWQVMGEGILLLTILYKTDHTGSMI